MELVPRGHGLLRHLEPLRMLYVFALVRRRPPAPLEVVEALVWRLRAAARPRRGPNLLERSRTLITDLDLSLAICVGDGE